MVSENKENTSEINDADDSKARPPASKRLSKPLLFALSALAVSGLICLPIYYYYLLPAYQKTSAEYFEKAIQCRDVNCKIENYTRAIDYDGTNSLAYLGRFLAYKSVGQIRKSGLDMEEHKNILTSESSRQQQLEDLIKAHPDSPELHLMLGYHLYKVGGEPDEESIESLSKAIELDNKLGVAYFYRAKAVDPVEQKLSDLAKSIQFNPKLSEAYAERIWINYYKPDAEYAKVITDLNTLIELEKGEVSPSILTDHYFKRAYALLETGEIEKALADIQTSQEIETENNLRDSFSRKITTRGRIYLKLKEYDKALMDLNEAIRQDKNWSDAYIYRGILFAEKKEYEKALSDLNQALALKDDPLYGIRRKSKILVYETRASIYQAQEKNDLAQADLAEAERLRKDGK
jgi:tetratricopeptide (TPR) repeat protein